MFWYIIFAVSAFLLLIVIAWTGYCWGSQKLPLTKKRTVAQLERTDGDRSQYTITSDTFRIGRHSENELTLDDPTVSRHHAEIRRQSEDVFAISDIDSMNGVIVNNLKVKTTVLWPGDLIELGEVQLRFKMLRTSRAYGAKANSRVETCSDRPT